MNCFVKRRYLQCTLATMLLTLLSPTVAATEPQQDTPLASTVQWMGSIESPQLHESSGLAASQIHANILWSINDSGSAPELFALTTEGQHLGVWQVDMSTAADWEAMTSFTWRGKAYLLIGDIGDNFGIRSTVSFTIIEEPDVLSQSPSRLLTPSSHQRFTYPDGAKDSEAIAVDIQKGEVLVLSKRISPPRLYRIPLNLEKNKLPSTPSETTAEAELLTELTGFDKPPKAAADLYGDAWTYLGAPTGMSLSGDRLLVTTLEHAYLFDRKDLKASPQLLRLPFAGQREAITFAKDSGNTAFVSHEREYGLRKAEIYRVTFIAHP